METESKRRVEQLRLLLDVGKSIVSHRNLREMIGAVSDYLRRVIRCDEVWMLLAEPGSDERARR